VNEAEIEWLMTPGAPDDLPLTLEDFLARPSHTTLVDSTPAGERLR